MPSWVDSSSSWGCDDEVCITFGHFPNKNMHKSVTMCVMEEVSQRLLQERAKRLAKESVQDNEIPLEMVLLHVGGEQYALELTRLKAVLPAEITMLPLAPRSVAGVMNVRGEIVSVLDLAALLKFDRDEKAVASVVLTETSFGSIGLRITGVPELYQAFMSQLTPALSGRDSVKGVFNGRVAWLDVDALCGGLDL
jgi:purine-binding chemotaxis protein CheW